MALELVAAIVAAIAFAGIALIARKISGGLLPKWAVTVAAAVGLIGTTIWLEYDWFNRVTAALPASFEVVDVQEEAMPLRPWTYLKPIRMRFLALDHAKTATHPQVPGLRMVTLYSFARWKAPQAALMAVDCAANRRVLVSDGVEITPDGTLKGAEWQVAGDGDKLQEAACREG